MADKFDAYAGAYEELHKANIAASGEDPSYFHDYKMDCLGRLGLLGPGVGDECGGPVLDYGCGVGNLTSRLVARLPTERRVHGYDPSAESLAHARRSAPGAVLHESPNTLPQGRFAFAVLSGVLHHVRPEGRPAVLDVVRRSLRAGGKIVVFEHNPLNPLTLRAVKTCEFDDDAVLLPPWTARRTLSKAGFEDVRTDYIVFFPKLLAFLRPLERHLRFVGIGAQQMVVGTKR